MKAYYDLYSYKIGDKVASCYWIIANLYKYPEGLAIIDPTYCFRESFPIKHFCPVLSPMVIETLDYNRTVNELHAKGYEKIKTDNLWIEAPSIKLDTGATPELIVPQEYVDFANAVEIDGKKLSEYDYKIVNHCLLDAPYNVGRNHTKEQWVALMDRIRGYLKEKGINGVVIDIRKERVLAFTQIAGLISTANLFIGGDTGSSHMAAALKKEIVAIYGNNSHDVAAYSRGRHSSPWNSDPISDTCTKFVMTNNRFDEQAVFEHIIQKIRH